MVLASGTGGVAYLPPSLAKKFDLSAKGLRGINFIYGSQGATRLDLVPLLAWEMLGLKVEPVFGLKGRGDGRLMFERGEANIDYQTSSSYLKGVVPLVEEGKAVPMMNWGSLDADGNIIRDPTFPDMLTFKEICDATAGCETKGEQVGSMESFLYRRLPRPEDGLPTAGRQQRCYRNLYQGIPGKSMPGRTLLKFRPSVSENTPR